ncbi:MAG: hypothetical protein JO033_07345 [Acidobacteriaceae bacterium]|nr:hypothetical protein [Acidobacteriaceae bacterium]MBV9501588.1 hypothetical protein [Acidobacteriaceae bacterium]
MGDYLQQYGVSEERRNRVIKWIILGCLGLAIVCWIFYLVFHNYSETQSVKQFLAQVNAHNYPAAYSDWGCTVAKPCTNYDYERFLRDWGPEAKATSLWTVANVDGCKSFVTVNVKANGAELQSLAVQRGSNTIMYAPAPECQEPQWHWKAFFHRIFGGGSGQSSSG